MSESTGPMNPEPIDEEVVAVLAGAIGIAIPCDDRAPLARAFETCLEAARKLDELDLEDVGAYSNVDPCVGW